MFVCLQVLRTCGYSCGCGSCSGGGSRESGMDEAAVLLLLLVVELEEASGLVVSLLIVRKW